ncbi:hypothetical protein NLM27_24080 [Bradyrhizobium sp. CCGB12]|uniref:hypothetical protein n=1 Tax=Bradyrhizobium sp. CCGB12 TaxID=2949632 RepID=UPI0020B26FFB|nr:hypothetical protein [Bradyrhizobium sp. CCGB12]MCP3391876.1 hypothetical protein [Bradyrhizobium sp. CCGB12]
MLLAGGAAVFVDVQGSQVIVEGISNAARAVVNLSDDVVRAARGVIDDIGGMRVNPKRYAMTLETANLLGNKIDDLAKDGQVFVVESGFGAVPLRILPLGNGTLGRFREVSPGLIVRLDQQMTEEVVELLKSPVQTERIRVAAFFDGSDVDSIKRLADAAGDKLTEGRLLVDASGKIALPYRSGDVVIAIGHVEDGSFVARSAGGNVTQRIAIAELEAAADDAGVTVLTAGCSCVRATGRSGFVDSVTDVGISASLSEAMNAKSYAQMLGAFGRSESPYVITGPAMNKLAEHRVLELEQLVRHEKAVNTGAFSLRLVRFIEAEGIVQYLIPWWGFGIVAFTFMFRRNRAAYLRLFPIVPNPRLHPTWSIVVKCGREILFFVVAPLISALVAISFLFGGWSFRDFLHEHLWSAFLRPLHFVISTIFFVAFIALRLGLIVAFCLPAVLALAELAFSFERYPTYVLVVASVLMIPYAVLAWRTVKHLPGWLVDWISEKNWPVIGRVAVIVIAAFLIPGTISAVTSLGGMLFQMTRLPAPTTKSATEAEARLDCENHPASATVCKAVQRDVSD